MPKANENPNRQCDLFTGNYAALMEKYPDDYLDRMRFCMGHYRIIKLLKWS